MGDIVQTCCIKGCEKEVQAMGMCNQHYRRTKLYGSPMGQRNFASRWVTVEERFWSRVKKTSGCWMWMGGRDVDGYGVISGEINGERLKRAHRVSYAMHKGMVGDFFVCHSCDTPACVKPSHLFLGTVIDNNQQKAERGRHRVLRGQDARNAKLTEGQVKVILADPRPFSQIANEYGVATTTVGSIKQRQSWKHLKITPVITPKAGRVLDTPRHAKLTKEQVLSIRASATDTYTLAAKHAISPQAIRDIRNRKTWRNLY